MSALLRPDSVQERDAVQAEAALWLRTPYHSNARILGAGVDCAQFPAAVYEGAGLIPHVEPRYAAGWHLHRDQELYAEFVLRFTREIPFEDARPADLVLWKWGRAFSHGGILLPEGRVIHAYVGIGVTVDRISQHEELKQRPKRAFTVWSV